MSTYWTMVCPEIQLSDTRGVSVRMCLGGYVWVRLTFESVDWGKQIDCLLQSGNASSNPWRVWRGQEAGKREFALSAWASSSWELVSSCFQIQIGTYTIGFPGSQGFKLRLKLYRQLSCVSRLASCSLWNFPASITVWASPSQQTINTQERIYI